MKRVYEYSFLGFLIFTSAAGISQEKQESKENAKPATEKTDGRENAKPSVTNASSARPTESKVKEAEKSPQKRSGSEKFVQEDLLKKKYEMLSRLSSDVVALEKSLNVGEVNHEFFGNVSYTTTTGSIQAADQTEATKIQGTNLGLLLGYGYIIGDHLEPILEVEQHALTQKIATYSSKESTTDVTVGLLVNLPIAGDIYVGRKFYYADWIPYVGFAFTNRSGTNTSGTSINNVVSKKGTISKVTVGNRYRLFDHVSTNSHIRLSYESNDSSATLNSKLGSTSQGLTVEIQIFGLSILF